MESLAGTSSISSRGGLIIEAQEPGSKTPGLLCPWNPGRFNRAIDMKHGLSPSPRESSHSTVVGGRDEGMDAWKRDRTNRA